MTDQSPIRTFDTGATRNSDTTRHDPEGYFSPLVFERFCEYMTKHRALADGSLRGSDNWQKGIPFTAYIKGLFRHFVHAWTRHRGWVVNDPKAEPDLEGDLCAIIFNAQGYLHELLKSKIPISDYLARRDSILRGSGTCSDSQPVTTSLPQPNPPRNQIVVHRELPDLPPPTDIRSTDDEF